MGFDKFNKPFIMQPNSKIMLSHICRARTTGTEPIVGVPPGSAVDLPTELSQYGESLTWDPVAKEFTVERDGIYMITGDVQTENTGSVHNPACSLAVNRAGAGYLFEPGTTGINGNAVRNKQGFHGITLALNKGDKLQLRCGISTGAANIREGTSMTIVQIG